MLWFLKSKSGLRDKEFEPLKLEIYTLLKDCDELVISICEQITNNCYVIYILTNRAIYAILNNQCVAH